MSVLRRNIPQQRSVKVCVPKMDLRRNVHELGKKKLSSVTQLDWTQTSHCHMTQHSRTISTELVSHQHYFYCMAPVRLMVESCVLLRDVTACCVDLNLLGGIITLIIFIDVGSHQCSIDISPINSAMF